MALQTTGLEFFYLSVDFFENDKILLVEQELGSRATLLVLRLLARIYHKGYFCRWGKDECLLFTRRLPEGCTADYVQQVVDALLERGFFSKVQYEKFGIEELQREKLGDLVKLKLGTTKDAKIVFGDMKNLLGAYYQLQQNIYQIV